MPLDKQDIRALCKSIKASLRDAPMDWEVQKRLDSLLEDDSFDSYILEHNGCRLIFDDLPWPFFNPPITLVKDNQHVALSWWQAFRLFVHVQSYLDRHGY